MEGAVSTGNGYCKETAVQVRHLVKHTTVIPDGSTSLLSKTMNMMCMIQDVVEQVEVFVRCQWYYVGVP
jgi:hypothetical protein